MLWRAGDPFDPWEGSEAPVPRSGLVLCVVEGTRDSVRTGGGGGLGVLDGRDPRAAPEAARGRLARRTAARATGRLVWEALGNALGGPHGADGGRTERNGLVGLTVGG